MIRAFILFPIVALAACGPSQKEIAAKQLADKKAAEAQSEKAEETKRVAIMKANLTKDFLDPSSVQYRNLRYDSFRICGEVNAKNGFGAYSGFTRFVAMSAGKPFIERETQEIADKSAELGAPGDGQKVMAGFNEVYASCVKDGEPVT